jgi:hypothetical protein
MKMFFLECHTELLKEAERLLSSEIGVKIFKVIDSNTYGRDRKKILFYVSESESVLALKLKYPHNKFFEITYI